MGGLERLREALGERVHTDPSTLESHRHDWWLLAHILDQGGQGFPEPCAVVRATSTEDVSTALRVCRQQGMPVIPYGAGSGVCGGIRSSPDAVVLSTEAMTGLVEFDDESLTATFRAGTLGMDAERRVRSEGLTIGHWPQSIELSSVGGWVATRAAGQFSTAYGNIEDLVLDLEVVLSDGRVLRTRRAPRAATGPDLRHLFLGSEGTLGVVTQVTFSLRPLPEASIGQAIRFPSFRQGLDAIRRLLRVGWAPAVVRLYDPFESATQFSSSCPAGESLLLLLHEGPQALVEAQLEAADGIGAGCGGVESDPAAVAHWLEHRNRVPDPTTLLSKGLVAETIEVSATWDRVGALYEAVIASLRTVPDLRVASAHSSHSYRSGTNLYFTFAVLPGERSAMADAYHECWRRTLEATLHAGGSISHHHGIGRVRRNYLERELGSVGLAVLRGVKDALDPAHLLNPGNLLPDA